MVARRSDFEDTGESMDHFLELEILDTKPNQGVLSTVDNGFFVHEIDGPKMVLLANSLRGFSDSSSSINGVLKFLTEAAGTWTPHVYGFYPINGGVLDVEIGFGHAYMPELDACTMQIQSAKQKKKKANLKLKFFGFNGGGGTTFFARTSQSETIRSTPKDFFIPITVQYTLLENEAGARFPIFEVLNCSEWINMRDAENPWAGPDGYEELKNRRGNVSQIRHSTGRVSLEREDEIQKKTTSFLSVPIQFPYFPIDATIDCSVEWLTSMTILYSLDPEYEYIRYASDRLALEHYWSWRPPRR